MNQAPLKRLGSRLPGVLRTPVEVLTTTKPVRPLLAALPTSKYPTACTDDESRVQQIIEIDRLQSALDEMHKDVSTRVDAARARQVLRHNSKTNVLPANFRAGDIVLVRRAQQTKGHKLRFV